MSLVRVGGQQRPAVRIQIDPAKLVEKNLQLEDIRAQIAKATIDSPKGAIIGRHPGTFTIVANDQLTDAKAWDDVIVAYRNGAPERVRDIGRAVAGPQELGTSGLEQRQAERLLVGFKIPGANVINTVEAIKATLATLQASIPPTIHVSILSDPNQNNSRLPGRRRVHARAHHCARGDGDLRLSQERLGDDHPQHNRSVGAARRMRAHVGRVGYSLDNLSLMAFTISVGFVVDDAIVMLENITRHIEEGEKLLQAALKGSSEIGFTIISIPPPIAVLIVLLPTTSGIIGNCFREFSVTIAMTIFVSAVVSLTLTPMMASAFPDRATTRNGTAGFITSARKASTRSRAATHVASISCCATASSPSSPSSAPVIATGYLFVIIPKGFFPQQDTGVLYGTTEAGQDVSFPVMSRLQQEVGRIVMADPAIDTVAMGLGSGVGAAAQNTGRMFIQLKPFDERNVDIFGVIRRLRDRRVARRKGNSRARHLLRRILADPISPYSCVDECCIFRVSGRRFDSRSGVISACHE